MDTSDKVAFRGFLGMIGYVAIWFILYDPIWQTLPLIKAMFPLQFSNATLSYSDFVTSFAIIGFPIALYFVVIRPSALVAKAQRGFHRG